MTQKQTQTQTQTQAAETSHPGDASDPDIIDTFYVKYIGYYSNGQKPLRLADVEGTVTRGGIFLQGGARGRSSTLQFPIYRITSVVSHGVVSRVVDVKMADGSTLGITCKTAEGQERIKAAISAAMQQASR